MPQLLITRRIEFGNATNQVLIAGVSLRILRSQPAPEGISLDHDVPLSPQPLFLEVLHIQGHTMLFHRDKHVSKWTPILLVEIQQHPAILSMGCAPRPLLEKLQEPFVQLPSRDGVEGAVLNPRRPGLWADTPVQVLHAPHLRPSHHARQGLLAPRGPEQLPAQDLELVALSVGVLQPRHVHGVAGKAGHGDALVVEHRAVK
mmetsp:Transcript_109353/g.304838  ORF Transcript_109353/g.304838 Transcript_109353/m.304838 type:complete len:202 (-) Transcript_109353:1550-2155(-)